MSSLLEAEAATVASYQWVCLEGSLSWLQSGCVGSGLEPGSTLYLLFPSDSLMRISVSPTQEGQESSATLQGLLS